MASSSPATMDVHSSQIIVEGVRDPLRIIAIDVGAGTQDVLVYDSSRSIENSVRLVLPSQTQVVARRIRQATVAGASVHLTGSVMGGGAMSWAIDDHLAAGFRVSATCDAARSIHNDLDRVRGKGIEVRDTPHAGDVVVRTSDLDLDGLRELLDRFGVDLPDLVAVAVQDHGYLPDAGGREFRYEFLQTLLATGGDLGSMIYQTVPDYMVRMQAVLNEHPGAFVMDTGAAAVLGALGDPLVAHHASTDGAILVNVGNMHTFGVALRGDTVFGLFEHHTGGTTAEILATLVQRLSCGSLTHDAVVELGGHGAAFHPDYAQAGPFVFVTVTGPNRRIARPLGLHEAAPHGDMMLTGAFGLVEAVIRRLSAADYALPVATLIP